MLELGFMSMEFIYFFFFGKMNFRSVINLLNRCLSTVYVLEVRRCESDTSSFVKADSKLKNWQQNLRDSFVYPARRSSCLASLVAQMVKRMPAIWETRLWSLSWENPPEKGMATYSSTLAWKIPWTEESGRQQPMGPQKIRHDWVTSLSPCLCPITKIKLW